MRTRSASATVAFFAGLAAAPVAAHTGVDTAIPESPGTWLGVAAAVAWTHAGDALPSQGLPGFLLLGDPGVDRRGGRLEHAVVQLGHRFDDTVGAHLAIGRHDGDPWHLESAWLQARGRRAELEWVAGAGRERPPLGPVVTDAGHFDAFGAMPLAKAAVTDGDWIEDGLRLGVESATGRVAWQADLGVWSGRVFPGARPGGPVPSVHLGIGFDALGGAWSVDTFAAWLRPAGRGARPVSPGLGHTHDAPRCDVASAEVVCFDGRSRIVGWSLSWAAEAWPLVVSAAVLWRDESGTLSSNDGIARYAGSTRGDWIQAIWRVRPRWETGVRLERLAAEQSLDGPGASILATDTGLDGYRPQRRVTAMAGFEPVEGVEIRLEGGSESRGATTVRFAGVRVIGRWGHRF